MTATRFGLSVQGLEELTERAFPDVVAGGLAASPGSEALRAVHGRPAHEDVSVALLLDAQDAEERALGVERRRREGRDQEQRPHTQGKAKRARREERERRHGGEQEHGEQHRAGRPPSGVAFAAHEDDREERERQQEVGVSA